MSIHSLPFEIQYEIIAEVATATIDYAITAPSSAFDTIYLFHASHWPGYVEDEHDKVQAELALKVNELGELRDLLGPPDDEATDSDADDEEDGGGAPNGVVRPFDWDTSDDEENDIRIESEDEEEDSGDDSDDENASDGLDFDPVTWVHLEYPKMVRKLKAAEKRNRRAKLKEWEVEEDKEPLPPNTLLPLAAISHRLREVAAQVFNDTLGITLSSENGFSVNPLIVLKALRRQYRVGHEPLFELDACPDWTLSTLTPFVDAYLCLSTSEGMLSRCLDLDMGSEHFRAFIGPQIPIPQMPHVPQDSLRYRVALRDEALVRRAQYSYALSRPCSSLTSIASVFHNVGYVLTDEQINKKIPKVLWRGVNRIEKIRKEVEQVEAEIGMNILNRELIELIGVLDTLEEVKMLKDLQTPEQANKEIERISEKAGLMLEAWERRADEAPSYQPLL